MQASSYEAEEYTGVRDALGGAKLNALSCNQARWGSCGMEQSRSSSNCKRGVPKKLDQLPVRMRVIMEESEEAEGPVWGIV